MGCFKNGTGMDRSFHDYGLVSIPDKPNCDRIRVIRAFFKNRLYFKFKPDKFFPNSEDEVERISARARESARKNQLIEEGSQWLKSVFHGTKPCLPDDKMEIVEMIQSFYLFEKESKHYAPCKRFRQAGIDDTKRFSVSYQARVGTERKHRLLRMKFQLFSARYWKAPPSRSVLPADFQAPLKI
jgi:hypothetical protein